MGEQDAEIYSLNINGIRVEDADTIANKFNDYFVNIAQVLAEKISASPIVTSNGTSNLLSWALLGSALPAPRK